MMNFVLGVFFGALAGVGVAAGFVYKRAGLVFLLSLVGIEVAE